MEADISLAGASCRGFQGLIIHTRTQRTGHSCLTKALSVLTLAFFRGETLGPIHVKKANLALRLISSPVSNRTYAYALWSSGEVEGRFNTVATTRPSDSSLNRRTYLQTRPTSRCTLYPYQPAQSISPLRHCRTSRCT